MKGSPPRSRLSVVEEVVREEHVELVEDHVAQEEQEGLLPDLLILINIHVTFVLIHINKCYFQ